MMFFDTSVIIAASSPNHPDHDASLRRLATADARGGACSAHSLSEVFSVLTRLPPPFKVPPSAAMQIVKHTAERFKVIALTSAEHLATISEIAQRGLAGGLIYDALILAGARKANSTRIYTLNPRHFKQIAPDLSARIFEP
jgi:predicted nucleic acid-binding protein